MSATLQSLDWREIDKYKKEKVPLRWLDIPYTEKSLIYDDIHPHCRGQIDGWLEDLMEQLLIKQVQ